MDYDSLRSEYSAFWQLLQNDRGVRMRLNLPDTLLLRDGRPLAWFATSQEGYVVQRGAAHASIDSVRQHLLACAACDGGGGDGGTAARGRPLPDVAVMRLADGLPKLLTRPAFEALCDRLAAAAAAGERCDPADTPCLLQAYVAPALDLRFVTSYSNDGASVACHTFQRRYSRRYLPHRGAAAAAAAASPGPDAGLAAAPGSPAAAPPVEAAAASAAEAGAAGGQGGEAAAALDDGALHDSERHLAAALGPVDPSLRMLARRAAHSLVQYVQKAHLLTLRGLVCEFARDAEGHLWFLGPLRADWASLIPGRGGEPWANANLTQQPRDEEEWGEGGGGEVAEEGAAPLAATGEAAATLRAGGCGGQLPARQLPSKALPAEAWAHADVSERLLSASKLSLALPDAQQQQQQPPGSPTIPSGPPSSAATALLPSLACSSPLASKPGLRCSPGPRTERGSPGTCAWRLGASASASPTAGSHGGGQPRGGTLSLASQLTKQLVTLEDELLVKSELADELACKVHALEQDRRVVTGAFEAVVAELRRDLGDVKSRLEALRRERDGLARQLAEANSKLVAAVAEREQLRGMLDSERGAAFVSLGQCQKDQVDAGERAARAEAELRVLQERLREEQAACDALKKQMVFCQHIGDASGGGSSPGGGSADGSPKPPGGAVDELLAREADPPGERYSLSKVLHTCQGDLHAIFLHYSMLDPGFARHWPPQMTLQGWLAFMKDVGSTNLVPGTRTRSDNTIHVQEAMELFRRCSVRQAPLRSAAHLASMPRDAASAAAAGAGAASAGDPPPRPATSMSSGPGALTARPFSAAASSLSSCHLTYQAFCAALVHVAAKVARGSPDLLEACPFLSEQTRAFVESVVPKAQQVAPISPASKKGRDAGSTGGAGGARASPTAGGGGPGAKEAAAKEAAARLTKGGKHKAGGSRASAAAAAAAGAAGADAVAVLSAITEASREASALPPAGGGSGSAA